MRITQSKTENQLATLTVEVDEKDYKDKINKILKDYRKNVQIPGFRKGKTPISIINKKYRISVTTEQVNKLLQDEMYKYITENKVKVLGSPMPKPNENPINWEKDSDFSFDFEIGLAPEFNMEITKKDKLNFYKIEVDKKLLNQYCNDIAKRYGKMASADFSQEGDLIFCNIEQLYLDGKVMENGIKNEATVSIEFIDDKKIKKQFIGVKIGDSFKVNVTKAFNNHTDLSAMLNIEHEAIHKLTSKEFQFTVKKVNRLTPAEFDSELFDKMYGKGKIKTIKEFKTKIKDEAESNLLTESDRFLKNDVVNYLMEKNQFDIPDDFLKRWLVKTSEKPITFEQVESEYDIYSKSLKWQLIENRITEDYKIKVTKEEVLEDTKKLIAIQMKQYGQPNADEKQLTDIANNILKNKEERKKMYNKLLDKRTLLVYKENFQIKEKKISYDDFVKLASEK
tara:strand:+ start:91 stop:1446 length:1356 start_codon:yes stop_codon:yes gene_type:complete